MFNIKTKSRTKSGLIQKAVAWRDTTQITWRNVSVVSPESFFLHHLHQNCFNIVITTVLQSHIKVFCSKPAHDDHLTFSHFQGVLSERVRNMRLPEPVTSPPAKAVAEQQTISWPPATPSDVRAPGLAGPGAPNAPPPSCSPGRPYLPAGRPCRLQAIRHSARSDIDTADTNQLHVDRQILKNRCMHIAINRKNVIQITDLCRILRSTSFIEACSMNSGWAPCLISYGTCLWTGSFFCGKITISPPVSVHPSSVEP